MSSAGFPVTVAVKRPDGSVEHVRVGTAVRVGDSFRLTLGELSIGGSGGGFDDPPPFDDGDMPPPRGDEDIPF